MKTTELVYVSYIRTTPEKLWAAITKPEFTRQYWAGNENISEWKKGSKWEHVKSGKRDEVMVIGEVLESNPPKLLVLSWADPDEPAAKSRVTFEIQPLEDMVSLRVVHGELETGSTMATSVSGGWPRVLSSLKSYLETGLGLKVGCGQ